MHVTVAVVLNVWTGLRELVKVLVWPAVSVRLWVREVITKHLIAPVSWPPISTNHFNATNEEILKDFPTSSSRSVSRKGEHQKK